jgi:hypothetical protein
VAAIFRSANKVPFLLLFHKLCTAARSLEAIGLLNRLHSNRGSGFCALGFNCQNGVNLKVKVSSRRTYGPK